MNRITNEQREAIVRKAIAERDALLADCSGGSPCSTCPDKKKCERGCIRKPEFIAPPGDARHAAAELVGGAPAAATDKDCWQAREAGGTGPICEPCNTGNRDKCLYKRAAGAPAVGDARDAARLMADEYQAWIEFYHRGDGDYADFLRSAARTASTPQPDTGGQQP